MRAVRIVSPAPAGRDITGCRELGGGDPKFFRRPFLSERRSAVRVSEPLPVMVRLHGGGYTIGAGSLPPHDGQALAKRGAIVVTVNYRLYLSLGFRASGAGRRRGGGVYS